MKTICPNGVECQDVKKSHLSEMSHPHLEKLLENQLTSKVVILPEVVPFNCEDKGLLEKQLKNLKIVLKTEQTSASLQPFKPSKKNNAQTKVNYSTPAKQTPKKSGSTNSFYPDWQKHESENTPVETWKQPMFERYDTCKSQTARAEFRHEAIREIQKSGRSVSHLKASGEFKIKHDKSFPYFVFFNCIESSPKTWKQPCSLTLPEILDISFGEIEKSLHLQYIVDVQWLRLQYLLAGQKTDGLIICDRRDDTGPLPETIKIQITVQSKLSHHHTKILVLKYNNGARIVVSSANMCDEDWKDRTQAFWISPHLPYLLEDKDSSMGESKTGFKESFINYIKAYKTPGIDEWLETLYRLDYSLINVFFISSVPGTYKSNYGDQWGLTELSRLLSEHAKIPNDGDNWPVVVQTSSIGEFGLQNGGWLDKEVIPALTSDNNKNLRTLPKLQFIYPTIKEYWSSFDGQINDFGLGYNESVRRRQRWFQSYMYKWKSDSSARTQAMPHSKLYLRMSPDLKKISWIVVTSGNLSRSAWGANRIKDGKTVRKISNYEAGVVLFPQFLTGDDTFPIQTKDDNNTPPFPLPFDLPLTSYKQWPEDKPFVLDILGIH